MQSGKTAAAVFIDNMALAEARERYGRVWREKIPGCRRKERVKVAEARGRVTSQPVYARCSSPHYCAAAMDGIAVCAADTFGASETSPVRLELKTQGLRVDTGDPLPAGKDAVIMIEHVHWAGPEVIEVIAPIVPGENVRMVGEDIVKGEMLLPAHHQLRPCDLGALLAGGVTEVEVYSRPRVAIIPTGTELVEPGKELKPGDIIEFNSRVLGAMVEEWGGTPLRFSIVADDYERLRAAVRKAAAEADIVLINAGSSAGREDFTAAVIRELGEIIVHGVAIRPGKPVILGMVNERPALGIPGYPVSAALTAELFVKPLIYAWEGLPVPGGEKIEAFLTRKTASHLGIDEFLRVKVGVVGGKALASPMGRGAGMIVALSRADGVVCCPANKEGFQAGEKVEVELLRPREEISRTLVAAGSHDLLLDLLDSYLRRFYPGSGLSSAHVGSLGGLAALRRGEAHLAGIHLLDEETGEYNIPYVRRFLAGEKVYLLHLACREQGLMVPRGNPKGIRSLADLARSDVTIVNRQRGAGTRILLDYELKKLGIRGEQVLGYDREEFTHMGVAAAVASGTADAGLGIRAAAAALGLDFVPVAVERYDLCIPARFWDEEGAVRLREVMALEEFRREAESWGGYDLRECGQVTEL